MYTMRLVSLGIISKSGASFTDWAGTRPVDPEGLAKAVPMMMRRRLHGAGRSAVALGCDVLSVPDHGVDLVVCASRTGESLRCLKMLKEVLAGNALSPADFSGSVHNATAGVLAIVRHFTGETTAVAAGAHTFRAGMEEAFAALAGGSARRVLVICFEDDLLGQEVMDFASHEEFFSSFAASFLLELPKPDGTGESRPEFFCDISFSGISAKDTLTAYTAARKILAGERSFEGGEA